MVTEPDPAVSRADAALDRTFDVAIVGGGVSGVALFRELARRGHSVLLVEKGDIASGTSQASGMLAWGGLLYLKNLEMRTVAKLSAARDRWIKGRSEEVEVAPFRYMSMRQGGHPAWWVRTGLWTYWLLGGGRRSRPTRDRREPEERWPFLAPRKFRRAFSYEEACMRESDARLVLRWLMGSLDDDRVCRARTKLTSADREGDLWSLGLDDGAGPREARARVLVNAAGVWADQVAELAGIRTQHSHVLSKGVYLVLRREQALDAFLAFDSRREVMTLTPWGPVALFGSTETFVQDPDEGFAPTAADVSELAANARQIFARPLEFDDVVSLRTGVRPLALERGARCPRQPQSLSRKHAVDVDRGARAISLYGGKFTSARALGLEAADAVEGLVRGSSQPLPKSADGATASWTQFPGHPDPVIEPGHARDHELCRTLEDYLRRRSPLAQRIPRLGLGRDDEYWEALRHVAVLIEGSENADAALTRLRAAADLQDEVVLRGLGES